MSIEGIDGAAAGIRVWNDRAVLPTLRSDLDLPKIPWVAPLASSIVPFDGPKQRTPTIG